ncbi:MAG: ABC transporter substrate-binding protein, partial [Solirubrobacteraceae bacterium]
MIEFRVLGSLEVVGQDDPLVLGGPKQRALLAVLVVHRGEPVSSERLIDDLWGEQAPPSAVKLVQGHVSSLRKVLGGGLLVTQQGGYLLRIPAGQLDVDRFESLVVAGRRALAGGDPRTAAARLREALEVWRGPPFADFGYESFAQSEIARLEESRLAALEARVEAELALGEHAGLVGELEALVREHPLRERLVGQLMLALYRSGRQADALEAYRGARRGLVEELGIEPAGELQRRQQAILTQDPALELKPPAPEEPGARRAVTRRRRRVGGLTVAGAALLLVALVAVATQLAGSEPSSVRVAPNSLAAIDVKTNRVSAAMAVGTRPGPIAVGSGSLWVANLDDQTVSRIDLSTLRTVRVIPAAAPPTGIAASGGGVWVVESSPSLKPNATPATSVSVAPLDPGFNSFGAAVPIGNVVWGGPGAIAARGGSVWVAPSTGLLTRLDGRSRRVTRQLDPNASPAGIAIGEDAVWLTDTDAGNVVRVDATGLSKPIPVGAAPTAITVGGGGVWAVDSPDDAVVRIDPGTRAVTATIPVGRSPAGVAFGAGSVWVANSGDGTVTRINPSTKKPIATIEVGGSPQALAIAGGRVWVTVAARSTAPPPGGTGGGTLRIASSTGFDALDPALVLDPVAAQLIYATCPQLVNYPDKAGPAGSQLVPEVAQALPTRSPDDRTYTFSIRPGFRFSPPSSEPVTAKTFKYSIERTLDRRMHSVWAQFLSDVVGANAYLRGKANHISGVIANDDTLTITLLAPSPDFLSRLALPAFCAVPSNTPPNPNGERMIPSAGPYYVTSLTPHQGVVVRRNPNYHGNRPHHFATIQVTFGVPPKRAAGEIIAGTADWTPLGLYTQSPAVAALASGLGARYGPGSPAAARGAQQYFVNPGGVQLDYFILNTHRTLFRDVGMRQAVNYAIDRRQLARLGNPYVPLPAHPTDHYLPPGMPGYRDTTFYPTTPNVAQARALAHGAGRTAVLYTCNAFPCTEQAQIVKNNLAAIGLQVEVEQFPLAKLLARVAQAGAPFDLAWIGWGANYLDPGEFLNGIATDDAFNFSHYHDPKLSRAIRAASRLSGIPRARAYAKIDLALTRDTVPWIDFANV